LTVAAILVSRGMKALQAAPAGEIDCSAAEVPNARSSTAPGWVDRYRRHALRHARCHSAERGWASNVRFSRAGPQYDSRWRRQSHQRSSPHSG